MNEFEQAAIAAAPVLGAVVLRTLADRVGAGWSKDVVLSGIDVGVAEMVRPILEIREEKDVPPDEGAAFLRGLAAGCGQRNGSVTVETVWSGPSSHGVPVRSTAQALIQVVTEATGELLLVTYSAKRQASLREALASAAARGVHTSVVVETLQGAGSALAGVEPAAAFAGIGGLELWHWPMTRRGGSAAKLHAKLAIADRRTMLVSSANLTQSGAENNIEAGVLIHGGTAPARAFEHIQELKSKGVLARLTVSGAS